MKKKKKKSSTAGRSTHLKYLLARYIRVHGKKPRRMKDLWIFEQEIIAASPDPEESYRDFAMSEEEKRRDEHEYGE